MKRQRDLKCYEILDTPSKKNTPNYGDIILEICLNNDTFHNTITPLSVHYGTFFHIMDRKFGNSEWWRGSKSEQYHFKTKVVYIYDEKASPTRGIDDTPQAFVYAKQYHKSCEFPFCNTPYIIGIRTCDDTWKLRGPLYFPSDVRQFKFLGKVTFAKLVNLKATGLIEPVIYSSYILHTLENPLEDLTFFRALNEYSRTTTGNCFFPTTTKKLSYNEFFYLNKFEF